MHEENKIQTFQLIIKSQLTTSQRRFIESYTTLFRVNHIRSNMFKFTIGFILFLIGSLAARPSQRAPTCGYDIRYLNIIL